jgi:hypothetical protein
MLREHRRGSTRRQMFCLSEEFKRVKSQLIPGSCHHDFRVLNRGLRPFRRFLVKPKPDAPETCGEIEPRPIRNDNELPTLMFD